MVESGYVSGEDVARIVNSEKREFEIEKDLDIDILSIRPEHRYLFDILLLISKRLDQQNNVLLTIATIIERIAKDYEFEHKQ